MFNEYFTMIFYCYGIIYIIRKIIEFFEKPDSENSTTKLLEGVGAHNFLANAMDIAAHVQDLNEKEKSKDEKYKHLFVTPLGRILRTCDTIWIILGLYTPEKWFFVSIIVVSALIFILIFVKSLNGFSLYFTSKSIRLRAFYKICAASLILYNHFFIH